MYKKRKISFCDITCPSSATGSIDGIQKSHLLNSVVMDFKPGNFVTEVIYQTKNCNSILQCS